MRPKKVDKEKYLEAVRRTKSLVLSDIASYLGCSKQAVFYFQKKNPDVSEEAKKIVEESDTVNFMANIVSKDVFRRLPIIMNWIDMQKARGVNERGIRQRLNAVYNVCKYLRTSPENLSPEIVGKLVTEMREKLLNDEDYPSGISYYSIRKPLRSFFQLTRKMSGEYLSSIGITAEKSKGFGSSATERITKEQRARFPLKTKEVIEEWKKSILNRDIDPEFLEWELVGVAQFMYYTGTRIGREKGRGALHIKLNDPQHKLDKDGFWYIHLIDKGKRGGIHWNKPLYGDGKEKLKRYLEKRFDIPYEDLENRIPTIDSYMFPTLQQNMRFESKIMKEILLRCGVRTKYPNHIWRHTYAQDSLHATDWNYELCASIGGWKDTNTMKLSYGKMSRQAQQRGLMRMMGLNPPDVTYELKW